MAASLLSSTSLGRQSADEAAFTKAMEQGDFATARKYVEGIARRMQNDAWASHSHSHSGSAVPSVPDVTSPVGRKAMIEMRLRTTLTLKNFASFLEGDTVYVAIVKDNGGVFLEDDLAMFPSDTFMTQLRLLL